MQAIIGAWIGSAALQSIIQAVMTLGLPLTKDDI